jgi:hypothetical protein
MRMIRTRPREAAPSLFSTTGASATPFSAEHVALAPAGTGVYFLYRRGRVIYIGVAVHGATLRQELERHLEGLYGPGTQAASSFDYELTRDPVVAKHEYLRVHKARHGGRLPACNAPES